MNDIPPINEACLRNQYPIAEQLSVLFSDTNTVLEIGSGTGQHAVFMCRHLPHVIWQPSEMPDRVADVEAWRRSSLLETPSINNLLPCKTIDVLQKDWQLGQLFDAVFTANTIHFIGPNKVEALLNNAAKHLAPEGQFVVYGPFNIDKRYTSEGNRQLDSWLKSRDAESGIKDLAAFIALANRYDLQFIKRHEMPANNMLLHFVKASC